MITFDILTLKAFINEQYSFFTGARINKIQQPTRREFIFTLRNNSETRQFYVNINPQMYHICFMSKENAEKRILEIPQKPPMFCMLLRKYLENSRIAKINQPDNERILEFYIETYNEIGDKIYLCLAFELMGKHSNVVLYNYDTNIIIGCAHNVGAEKSREREMTGTLPYVYPPKQEKMNILNYDGEVDYDNLVRDFHMFSNNLVELCKGQPLEKLKSLIGLDYITPCIAEDFQNYTLFSELLPNSDKFKTVNDMIDTYYAHHIALEKFKILKTRYQSIVYQKLKKLNKSLNQMKYRMLSDADSDKYRLWGDLIMANLYNLSDYSEFVEVYDYENDKLQVIELDAQKSLKENANLFYKLYNKAKTSKSKLSELIEDASETKIYLEQILYSIESSEIIEDLFEIAPEIDENRPKTKDSKHNVEVIKIDVDDNSVIYIGKNNKQNDYIISKLASDEDIWFHVHNCAGSHVLLKTKNPTDELIMKCARLAKEHSSVRTSSKIGVIYTKRKYLRKPPKAALGYVTYKNEKEIVLD